MNEQYYNKVPKLERGSVLWDGVLRIKKSHVRLLGGPDSSLES